MKKCSQGKVSFHHASWIASVQQFTFVIKHTYGLSNKVVDALSSRHSLLMVLHTSVLGFSVLRISIPPIRFWQPLPCFTRRNSTSGSFFFHGNHLCVPDCSLRLLNFILPLLLLIASLKWSISFRVERKLMQFEWLN